MKRKASRKPVGVRTKEKAATAETCECDICGQTFSEFSDLSVHISTHLTDTLHECEHCQEVFLHVEDLQGHQLVHGVVKLEPSLDTCAVKSDTTLDPWAVKSDPSLDPWAVKSDPSLDPWAVKSEPSLDSWAVKSDTSLDPWAVKSEPLLDTYTQTTNIPNVSIKEEPEYSFVNPATFCNLQPLNSNPITPETAANNDVQPAIWHQYTGDNSELHCPPVIKEEPAIKPQVFECNICAVTYTRMRDLLKHTREHMKTPKQPRGKKRKILPKKKDLEKVAQKQFECNICLKRFDRMKDLVNHAPDHADIAQQLASDKPVCQHCGLYFPTKRDFIQHMKVHEAPPSKDNHFGSLAQQLMSESEEGIVCLICGEKFEYDAQLNEHSKWCVEYICDICSQKFTTEKRLTEHLSSHLTDTLHECDHCQEVFLLKQDLVQHMDVHLINL